MSEGVKGRAWDSNRANFDRNLAVVIGIDRYENPSIRNLSTAVSDASAIADLLEQAYAYKQSDEKPEVIRLLDEAATLQGLRDLLTQTLPEQKLTEGDRLIVYFAGHGLPRSNEDGPEGYLVPHDADPTDPTSFLAMREVSDALSKLECHHLLVILDCCFAGTFRWAGSRKAVPILETMRREHYYHFIRHPAWQVITSSAHDQEALDVARLKEDNRQPVSGLNQPHSPFALALLEGLQPGNDPQRVKADLYPDGVVTAHELFVYLQSRVKELSGEQQAPGIYPLRRDYDKGEFIFTPPGFDPQKLAEALPLNEENNPYRGLKSFDEKHAKFFFGRQTLIEYLATRLAKPKQTLTVVLGVSGSGKSSLVKAGLMPYLRNQQTEPNTEQWRILDPMRPGVSPFTSLARTLLPIVNDSLLEQLAQVSFLDGIFQPMLKAKAVSEKDSEPVALMKVADSWCSATPEAKLLLIEDYFAQMGTLGNSQQQEQLKSLHDRILAEVDAVSHRLQKEPQTFSRAIATWSQNHAGVRLLLVIDQSEELLTRSQDDSAKQIPYGNRENPSQTEQKKDDSTEQKEWQKFLEVLSIAIAEHPQTLRLVLTLRSDFEPRFLSSALEPYWKDARFPVRAMISDELRQAIENPALNQALYFEELKDAKENTTGNLVSKLVDEVGQMPGALPLLSFTLSELYVSLYKRWQDDRSTDRTLRFADYDALGGVAGALTRRATEEYDALDEKHQATMRRVMLRMVAIEGGGVARRQVPESELIYAEPEENERVKQILDRSVHARLIVRGQEAGEPYAEPTHDFLVHGWDKLQEWIEKEQTNLTLQKRITSAAADWNNNSRSFEYLWIRDPRLSLLEELIESNSNTWLNQLELEFVEDSKAKRRDELEKAERQLKISEERRIEALSRQLAAQSELLQSQQPHLLERSVLLAVEAVKCRQSLETNRVLKQGLSLLPLPLKTIGESEKSGVRTVAFSPDGRYFAVGFDDIVQIWQWDGNYLTFLKDLKHKAQNEPPEGAYNRIFHISEGIFIDCQYLITISHESFHYKGFCSFSSIWLWDLVNDQSVSIKTIPVIVDFTFDANKKVLITASETHNLNVLNKVLVWQFAAGTWQPVDELAHEEHICRLSNSSDGELIAFAYKDKVVCQARNGQEYQTIQQKNVSELLFSPNAKYLITKIEDITNRRCSLHVWNLADGQEINRILQKYTLYSLSFSPDGEYLAAGSSEQITYVWKIETGEEVARIKHQQQVNKVSFSPISERGKPLLLTATATAQIWQLDRSPQVMRLAHNSVEHKNDQKGILLDAKFSPNGKYLATAGENHSVIIWDVGTGSRIATLNHSQPVKTVYFNFDDQYILSASAFKTWIWNWKEDTEKPLKTIERDHCSVFNPDSRYIASCSGNIVRIWDWVSDATVMELTHQDQVVSIAFSRNSELLVAGSMKGITIVWEIATGREVKKILPYKIIN